MKVDRKHSEVMRYCKARLAINKCRIELFGALELPQQLLGCGWFVIPWRKVDQSISWRCARILTLWVNEYGTGSGNDRVHAAHPLIA